jgi:hypothetical protein
VHVRLHEQDRKLLQGAGHQVRPVLRCHLQDLRNLLQGHCWLRQEIGLPVLELPQEHVQGYLRVSDQDGRLLRSGIQDEHELYQEVVGQALRLCAQEVQEAVLQVLQVHDVLLDLPTL